MPNNTPEQLDAKAATVRAARTPGPLCGTSTCVDAVVASDGVHVTSTIVGNGGLVVFTYEEWNAFLVQVKDGAWDHTLTRVPAHA